MPRTTHSFICSASTVCSVQFKMEEVCEHCPGGGGAQGHGVGGVCGSSLPSTQKKPTITGCKHPGPPLHQTSPPAWGLSCRATERRRPQPSRAIWPPPAPIHQTPVRVPGNSICMSVGSSPHGSASIHLPATAPQKISRRWLKHSGPCHPQRTLGWT